MEDGGCVEDIKVIINHLGLPGLAVMPESCSSMAGLLS